MKQGLANTIFAGLLLSLQIVIVFLYGFYNKHVLNSEEIPTLIQQVADYFAYTMNMHFMLVVGFPLVYSSFQRYRISSIVQYYWVLCVTVELYFLWWVFWKAVLEGAPAKNFVIDPYVLFKGELCAAALMITVCATMGRANNLQLLIITMIGTGLYTLIEDYFTSSMFLRVSDIGGAITVHTFGSLYGVFCALALTKKNVSYSRAALPSSFLHQFPSLLGTLILFAYWPAFNTGASETYSDSQKGHVNTYFAQIGSVLASYAVSILINGEGKFNLIHIFYSTISGGVIMGCNSDILDKSYVAFILGAGIGIITTFAFKFFSPISERAALRDYSVPLIFHAIPGICGGLLSAIFIKKYTTRNPGNPVAATFIAIGFGVFGGLIVGLICKAFSSDESGENYHGEYSIAVEEVPETVDVYGLPMMTHNRLYTEAQPVPEEQKIAPQ